MDVLQKQLDVYLNGMDVLLKRLDVYLERLDVYLKRLDESPIQRAKDLNERKNSLVHQTKWSVHKKYASAHWLSTTATR